MPSDCALPAEPQLGSTEFNWVHNASLDRLSLDLAHELGQLGPLQTDGLLSRVRESWSSMNLVVSVSAVSVLVGMATSIMQHLWRTAVPASQVTTIPFCRATRSTTTMRPVTAIFSLMGAAGR